MSTDSLLSGDNAAFVDEKYAEWLRDPASVEPAWAALFAGWERPLVNGGPLPGSAPTFRPTSIFRPSSVAEGSAPASGGSRPSASGASSEAVLRASALQAKVAQLVNAYRVRGHFAAKIDPLGERERVEHPELTLGYYGITEADLDVQVATDPLYGLPEFARVREIVEHCRKAYCTFLAAEYMNINAVDQKQWIARELETLPGREVLDRDEELHLLRRLSDAENFEGLLHTRFPGTKRFSLEGGETLIPLLDLVIEYGAESGLKELVFGMSHRGRLNVLANVLEKPVSQIVKEFQDNPKPHVVEGSGDVKYHLGYSSDRTTLKGHRVHLSLTPNPSHLEAVDPVALGRVRAKQDRNDGGSRTARCGIIVHGDAAFAGQGVVMETLQASGLRAYETGGTLHVIVNNQIGFTTQPEDGRSGPYSSDPARMLGIPIFHVNGESPRAVAAAVKIAVKFRQTFGRDVVIDMYCYRKHGHNEGDEPGFTQPRLYRLIRSRPTPRQVYAEWLEKIGYVTRAEAERIAADSLAAMQAEVDHATSPPAAPAAVRTSEDKAADPDLDAYTSRGDGGNRADKTLQAEVVPAVKGLWELFVGSIHDEADTSVPRDRLEHLLTRANTVPAGFTIHPKVARLLEQRLEMARGDRLLDWAVAEQAAFATLLADGYRVRMSGQDVGRGTFSHRHAVWTDVETTDEYRSLAHLTPDQAGFEIWDSHLSEYAVLGFEFGYSLDYPDGLVVWEAQFGDFANGAQIIIDQFIASSEHKWGRFSGMVLLLPHGYEGQGPEHSSARLERFLQLCADENWQVANFTTPANYFHALRRQAVRKVRKPLVVMAPKSLLRSPVAVNALEDLTHGAFQHVLPDPDPPVAPRRLVFCSGKVYFELAAERQTRSAEYAVPVALHRVEMLYPFPHAHLRPLLDQHPDAEVVWCQEEPKNQGAWPLVQVWFQEHFPNRPVRYVGRPASASPAGGSNKADRAQQKRLVAEAITLS